MTTGIWKILVYGSSQVTQASLTQSNGVSPEQLRATHFLHCSLPHHGSQAESGEDNAKSLKVLQQEASGGCPLRYSFMRYIWMLKIMMKFWVLMPILYCLPLISYFTCLACVLSHRIVGRIKQDKICWPPYLVFANPGKIFPPFSPLPK